MSRDDANLRPRRYSARATSPSASAGAFAVGKRAVTHARIDATPARRAPKEASLQLNMAPAPASAHETLHAGGLKGRRSRGPRGTAGAHAHWSPVLGRHPQGRAGSTAAKGGGYISLRCSLHGEEGDHDQHRHAGRRCRAFSASWVAESKSASSKSLKTARVAFYARERVCSCCCFDSAMVTWSPSWSPSR